MTRMPATFLTIALSLVTPLAAAQADPAALASEAERAERELDFAAAEARWRGVLDAAPTSRFARRADARLAWLDAHRDPDGAFLSLQALSRARRQAVDAAGLDRFASRVDAMPAGRVEREARELLAEGRHRHGDLEGALAVYDALLARDDLDGLERQSAAIARAEILAASGRGAEAVAAVEAAHLDHTFEGRELRVAETRRRIGAVAWALAGLALVALLAVGRPWRVGIAGARRVLSPSVVLVGVYVIGVPALVAEVYERTMAEAFLVFGAGIAPFAVLGLLGAESTARRPGASATRVLVAALLVAHAAVAYLALYATGGLFF